MMNAVFFMVSLSMPIHMPVRVCRRRHDVPLCFAKYMRSHAIMSSPKYVTSWDQLTSSMVPRIMDRYFAVNPPDEYSCDIFVIEGVPAAAILYNTTNAVGQPNVESIHINPGLLMLFDASQQMRDSLNIRYDNIDLSCARGVDAFSSCP